MGDGVQPADDDEPVVLPAGVRDERWRGAGAVDVRYDAVAEQRIGCGDDCAVVPDRVCNCGQRGDVCCDRNVRLRVHVERCMCGCASGADAARREHKHHGVQHWLMVAVLRVDAARNRVGSKLQRGAAGHHGAARFGRNGVHAACGASNYGDERGGEADDGRSVDEQRHDGVQRDDG